MRDDETNLATTTAKLFANSGLLTIPTIVQHRSHPAPMFGLYFTAQYSTKQSNLP